MGRGIVAAELRRFEETGKKVEENPVWKRREEFYNALRTFFWALSFKAGKIFCFL
jgi:hypothetical protein